MLISRLLINQMSNLDISVLVILVTWYYVKLYIDVLINWYIFAQDGPHIG